MPDIDEHKAIALQEFAKFIESLPEKFKKLRDNFESEYLALSITDFEGKQDLIKKLQKEVDKTKGIITDSENIKRTQQWIKLKEAGFSYDEYYNSEELKKYNMTVNQEWSIFLNLIRGLKEKQTADLKNYAKKLLNGPVRLDKEEMALAIYWKHEIDVKDIHDRMLTNLITAIGEKDLTVLIPLIGYNTGNPASTEIFENITGLNLGKTQKLRVEKLKMWAGYANVELYEKYIMEKEKLNDLVELRNTFNDLQHLRVEFYEGEDEENTVIKDGKAYILDSLRKGYTRTYLEKINGSYRSGIINTENGFIRSVKDRFMKRFVMTVNKFEKDGNVLKALEQIDVKI